MSVRLVSLGLDPKTLRNLATAKLGRKSANRHAAHRPKAEFCRPKLTGQAGPELEHTLRPSA